MTSCARASDSGLFLSLIIMICIIRKTRQDRFLFQRIRRGGDGIRHSVSTHHIASRIRPQFNITLTAVHTYPIRISRMRMSLTLGRSMFFCLCSGVQVMCTLCIEYSTNSMEGANNKVCCYTTKTCDSSKQLTLLGALRRREKLPRDGVKATKTTEKVREFIVPDEQPLAGVKNEGFCRLTEH